MRFCPYCSGRGEGGTGVGAKEGQPCPQCGGTGDLYGHLLDEAYRMGRDEALSDLRQVFLMVRSTGEHVSAREPPKDLKRSLGLGDGKT